MATIDAVEHGKANANGTRLHYVTAGEGPPVVLLHGWPQTWYEWRDVIPALAEDYTVIAPDLRGSGDSAKPKSGYDKRTLATDVHELVAGLGYDDIALVGHDWGMATAYAYAAQYRDEVSALAVLEASLPGINPEMAPDMWHFHFHALPDLPERLIAGNEEVYLAWFWDEGSYDPTAVDREARQEYLRCFTAPSGIRGGLEYYRARETDAEHNREHAEEPLEMPVLALGGEAVFGEIPKLDMEAVAEDVRGGVVERAGHWLPEERPEYFTDRLLTFLDDAY